MPIGDLYYHLYKSKTIRFILYCLGTPSIHTHIRLRPLMKFIRKQSFEKRINIIEVGCGNGINGLEIYKINKNIDYYGFDIDSKSIEEAKIIAKNSNIEDILHFFSLDATRFNFCIKVEKIDILLLINFLEHINDPNNFLKKIVHLLNSEALIIVSVPTYLYKKVFGNRHHLRTGHVKDGYNIKEICKLLKSIDFELVTHSYNTGLFSNIGCFFVYRT